MSAPVQIPPFDAEFAYAEGPMTVDARGKQVGLTELGAGFAEFTEAGSLSTEALPYEEMLYVLSGQLTVSFDDSEVVGRAGDMLILHKGVGATFTGTQGTRLVFSVVPQDWREHAENSH